MSTSTEHPPIVTFEKVHLKDVTEAVAAAAGDGTTPYVPQDSTGQQSAETVLVEAANIQKLVEKDSKEPGTLSRHRVVNEKIFPWRTIGKVIIGQGSITNVLGTYSGVLVGKNLMLTAGHVIPWGNSNAWIRFIPALNNGDAPFGSSFVENVHGYHQDEVNGLDYAICKLSTPLGNTTGWMGVQSYGNDSGYYNGVWTSVGYPIESVNPDAQFMLVEEDVRILDVDDEGSEGKELETHLYSLRGWAGGPLWAFLGPNDPRVIGVLSGEEVDLLQPRHTVSAGGLAMVKLVRYGKANWS